MLVVYQCKLCNKDFNGHWTVAKKKRKMFPFLERASDLKVARICPNCFYENRESKNLECDEQFMNKE